MEKLPPDDQNERNLLSRQRHAREALWQITLPLVISAVVMIIIMVLAVGLTQVDARRWGSISLIWLILPTMLAVLLTFSLLVASIFATRKIIQIIPGAAFRLQKTLNRLDAVTHSTSSRIVEPIIRLNMISTAIASLNRQVWRKSSKTA